MPKMKTKSAVKKRFSITASGKIKFQSAGHRHFMRRHSKRSLLNARKAQYLTGADAKIVAGFTPYGLD